MKHAVVEATGEDRTRFLGAVWAFLVDSDLPFNIFNKKRFWNMIHALRPVKPITRTGAMPYLDRLKASVSAEVRKFLARAPQKMLCATADSSSSARQHQFGTVTVHFIPHVNKPVQTLCDGDTWEIVSATLGANHFSHRERAEDIGAGVERLHQDLGLQSSDTAVYTLDGGSNYGKWARDNLKPAIPCCAHLLHHVADDATKPANVGSLRMALSCVQTITSFFHRSNTRTAELNKVARSKNISPSRLPTFSETRWLGRQPQLAAFLHMWPAILQLSTRDADLADLLPDEDQVTCLWASFPLFHRLFTLVTVIEGSNQAHLSEFLPMLGALHTQLSQPFVPTEPHPMKVDQIFVEPPIVKNFREALRSALRVRFELPERVTRPVFIKRWAWFLLATLLDPRFRDLSWLDQHRLFPSSDALKKSIHRLLDAAVRRVVEGRPLSGFINDSEEENMEEGAFQDVALGVPSAKRSHTDAYTPELAEQLFGIPIVPDEEEEVWEHQLQRWRDSVLKVKQHKSILWWWCHNEASFPSLAQVARQVFPIQVSGAASERVWSFLSNIDTPDRNALLPGTIEILLFLKFNMTGMLAEFDFEDDIEDPNLL